MKTFFYIMEFIFQNCSEYFPIIATVATVGIFTITTYYYNNFNIIDNQSNKVDVGVQTDALPQVVDSIDSMAEYPVVDYPVLEPTIIPNSNLISEVGVQTLSLSCFNKYPPQRIYKLEL